MSWWESIKYIFIINDGKLEGYLGKEISPLQSIEEFKLEEGKRYGRS